MKKTATYILLGSLLMLLITLAIIWISSPTGVSAHEVHPLFNQMMHGKGSQTQFALLSSSLVISIVGCLLGLLLFSVRKKETAKFIAFFLLVYLTTLLVLTNSTDSNEIVLGFPIYTSIMVYGLAILAVSISTGYVIFYRSWIVSEEDIQVFHNKLKDAG